MQKYKITAFGRKLLRLKADTLIVVKVGNKPSSLLWKPIGKPY